MKGQLKIDGIKSSRLSLVRHWQEYLADTLGWSSTQIVEIPETNLIALYRDQGHLQCIALIADKDIKTKDLFLQTKKIRAEFAVQGTPDNHTIWQVGPYALLDSALNELPCSPSGLRRREPISKKHQLLPFRDEDQLRRAFSACHDTIFFATAKDPAAAFDFLSLIIAAKVLDEMSPSKNYEFAIYPQEPDSELIERFIKLLNNAKHWLQDQDSKEIEIKVPKTLPANVVISIIREFQDFSFRLTGRTPLGSDLLGVAYESMVGATFRGELGSYFTPRNIADFMVRLLDIRDGKLMDPACGSGGLLTAANRYARSVSQEQTIEFFGNDLNPRMVQAAKLNFLMNSLNPARVIPGDGLEYSRMLKVWLNIKFDPKNKPLWDCKTGPFDYVLANPPFAGHEKQNHVLQNIATAIRPDGSIRSINRTLPFLELIVAALKEGGKAGIVIPTSILNAEDETFVRFREMLLEHAELVAIIGLPEKAFVHTDCGVHGALLFFKRVSTPRKEYDVFVGFADHLGYDRLGKPTKTNDFPDLVERFHSKKKLEQDYVSISNLRRFNRWDPTWLRQASSMPDTDSTEFVSLSELVKVRHASWSRRQLKEEHEYKYFEVSDADITTGKVTSARIASGFELSKKGRIKNQVRSGDILLPNHRDSLIAKSAENGRAVVLIDDALDGVLTTDRFMILRPNIDPTVLATLLNSKGVRRQLVARSRGAASLDIREHSLKDVLVPKSFLKPKMTKKIQSLRDEITDLRTQLEMRLNELDCLIEKEFQVGLDKSKTDKSLVTV